MDSHGIEVPDDSYKQSNLCGKLFGRGTDKEQKKKQYPITIWVYGTSEGIHATGIEAEISVEGCGAISCLWKIGRRKATYSKGSKQRLGGVRGIAGDTCLSQMVKEYLTV